MCSTRHVDEAKVHLHKDTWSASPSPVRLAGESQSAEAFTRFCRPIVPVIQPGIIRCHREVKDYLKVRTVHCVGITAHVWLLTCGTKSVGKILHFLAFISLDIFFTIAQCAFFPSTFQFVHEKAPVIERCSTPPFCCCINQLYTPSLAGKWTPLWPVWCKLYSDSSCLVGEKKRGHLAPVA